MNHQNLPSKTWLRKLNGRQRKKLRVGEFAELAVELRLVFDPLLDEAAFDRLLDGFIPFVESRGLLMAGFGGAMPLAQAEGYVCKDGRGSVTQADVAAILDWLASWRGVSKAEAGPLMDAWYGWG